VANDEGLVEGDGDEPAEVAADEGVVERDGVEPVDVTADSDVAVPLFVQPSLSHWQLISAPSHWHVIPQRQRTQDRWKEAEELLVQAMETRNRVLGQEHPDTPAWPT
jgi:hypothetical protein